MNNLKNQTGHHYETEKGVHIGYKLDERKKKNGSISMMFRLFS